MDSVSVHLLKAVGDGVISDSQAQALVRYFPPSPEVAYANRLDEPEEQIIVDTETPRFVRGFHDILITIGMAVLLSGVFGIGSFLSAIPVIIILSELLVRRQRLALPAILLTSVAVYSAFSASIFLAMELLPSAPEPEYTKTAALLIIASMAVLTGLYYWRYRVPLSLALVYFLIAGFVATVLYITLGALLSTDDLPVDYPRLAGVLAFAIAVILFVVAMRYDLSDRLRVTPRSDVAFWLHLVTAPALLYASFYLLVSLRSGADWEAKMVIQGFGALDVTVIVTALTVIGIIIDRRAFVTSGIASVVAAVLTLLSYSQFDGVTNTFIALILVGLIVVSLGIGWQPLRRRIIGLLPVRLSDRLPPAV